MTETLQLAIDQTDTRGQAHLARADMTRLGLAAGQTARLGGEARATHVRLRPGMRDPGSLGVDAQTARNAGLAEGAAARLDAVVLAPLGHVLLRLEGRGRARPEDLADALYDMTLTTGDRLRLTLPGGGRIICTVSEAGPDTAGLIGSETSVMLETPPGPADYDTIGGLSEQIARVQEMIETPLTRPALYDRLGLAPPRGVLFTGPPGSGKTLLARAVADRSKAAFFHISGPEILSKHYGDSEAALRRVFDAAGKAAPAIVFIDEIDAIAPGREALSGDKQVERRLVAQLLTLMDGLTDRGRIIVMAATNLPDALDPALRRPGRFDREIAFTPPTPAQRRDILEVHLAKTPLADDVDLGAIAGRSQGYVGADLAALTREAAVAALARAAQEAGGEAQIDPQTLFVTQADLETGLSATAPSALRASAGKVQDLGWAQIGGLETQKAALRRAVLWPLQHQDRLAALRLRPARGVLLTGPPGAGKTLIARALAAEAALNFVPVRAPALLSQYFGEAERAIATLFRTARQSAPCLLFFDEFDTLAPCRRGQDAVLERVMAQLLVEIDGIGGGDGVIVLAATNRAAAIDPALIRPGRFDTIIALPLPDAAGRRAILQVHLDGRPCGGDIDLEPLVAATVGASGADLAALVEEAARQVMVRCDGAADVPVALTQADLHAALDHWRTGLAERRSDYIVPSGKEPA